MKILILISILLLKVDAFRKVSPLKFYMVRTYYSFPQVLEGQEALLILTELAKYYIAQEMSDFHGSEDISWPSVF
jgi:hypothetical protein